MMMGMTIMMMIKLTASSLTLPPFKVLNKIFALRYISKENHNITNIIDLDLIKASHLKPQLIRLPGDSLQCILSIRDFFPMDFLGHFVFCALLFLLSFTAWIFKVDFVLLIFCFYFSYSPQVSL